jgi:hypothetical protein
VGEGLSSRDLGTARGRNSAFKLTIFGTLVAAIGIDVLIASGIAQAQIGGALQYPPASVGEDAQPPPPARMVPQIISPRRIELGVSGSSQPPAKHPYQVRSPADINRPLMEPPLRLRPSPAPPSTSAGN